MQVEKSDKVNSNATPLLNKLFFVGLIICILLLVIKVVIDIGFIDSSPVQKDTNTLQFQVKVSSDQNSTISTNELTKAEAAYSNASTTTLANKTIYDKISLFWNSIIDYFSNWIYEYKIIDPIATTTATLKQNDSKYSLILHDAKIENKRCYLQFQIIEMPLINDALSYNDFIIAKYIDHITNGLERALEKNNDIGFGGVINGQKTFTETLSNFRHLSEYYQKTKYLTDIINSFDKPKEPTLNSDEILFDELSTPSHKHEKNITEWLPVKSKEYDFYSNLKGKTVVLVKSSIDSTQQQSKIVAKLDTLPGYEYVDNAFYGVWYQAPGTEITRWYWFAPFLFWSKDFGLPEIITKEDFKAITVQENDIWAGDNPNQLYYYHTLGSVRSLGHFRSNQSPKFYRMIEKNE